TQGACVASFVWQKRYPIVGVRGIGADTSGNAVLAGGFMGTIDFGGGPIMTATGVVDSFLLKLGPNGDYLLSRPFHASPNHSGINDLVVDTSNGTVTAGDSIVVGDIEGSLDFGAGHVLNTSARNAFVTTVDTAGVGAFANAYGGAQGASARAVSYGA